MRLTLPIVGLAVLAACAPTSVDDRASQTVPDAEPPGIEGETGEPKLGDVELCDARDYRHLMGSDVAATTFPTGARLRVFGVNDIVTQDYIPQRTNVVYGENGAITRVYCG